MIKRKVHELSITKILGLQWDKPFTILPPGILKVWHNIVLGLGSFDRLVVPRWYGKLVSAKGVDLHGFSDASIGAYGCCIYIRIKGQDGSIHSSFVTSKSRVAPMKQMLLPKLELKGSTLLAHVIILVLNCHHLFTYHPFTVGLTL